MSEGITKRQEEVLQWVCSFIDKVGYPPTRAEVAKGMGFASANAAQEHLQALVRKHYITMADGVARGIVVVRRPVRWNKEISHA